MTLRTAGSIAFSISVLALSIPDISAAEVYSSREGLWILNIGESHHEVGDPLPKESQIHVIKDDGTTLQFSIDWTSDKGEKKSYMFDGKYGDKQVASDGEVLEFSHVSSDTFKDTGKYTDLFSWDEICVFSDDQATIICKGADKDKVENTFPYKEVWKRQ